MGVVNDSNLIYLFVMTSIGNVTTGTWDSLTNG